MPAPIEDDRRDGPPALSVQCAELFLESGEVVLYDMDNHTAWIQSDECVALEALV